MKDLCLNTLTEKIMPLVYRENVRQLEKWGVQDRDPAYWLVITAEEFGEIAKAILEWRFGQGSCQDVVKEAVETATLCLKIAEMFNDLAEGEG